jgi:putative SOS response-associated peptidase YedK
VNRNHPIYNLRTGREYLARAFGAVDAAAALEKDYVSPGRPGLVVVERTGSREVRGMRWGFPPPAGVKLPVVNVRNYASPFWRSALANPERRCLVPVTSFQEWSAEPDPMTGRKRPHWFSVPSRPVFAFAGVWRPVGDGAAYAFLTTGYEGDPAAHVVGAVHPKACPVMLHDEDHDRWLRAPIEEALTLATAYPSQLLRVDA